MGKFKSKCHNNIHIVRGNSHVTELTIGKEYVVEIELNNRFGYVYQIYDNGPSLGHLKEVDFCDFFYTKDEMRDIKLNEILND